MNNPENPLDYGIKNNKNNFIETFEKFASFGDTPFGLNFSKENALMFEGLTDNVLFFLNYYSHFSNIVLSRYSWNSGKELPAVSFEFIEKMLFWRGACAIINHKDRGLMACNFVVLKNQYNSFFEPQKIQAINYATGEKIGEYDKKDFVIIKNNFLWYPTNLTVMRFCGHIANLDIATKINTFSQQMPILLQGTEKQKKTMQEFVQKIELGERYIFADKETEVLKDITTLDIREPFIAKDLMDVKDRYINQLLSLLGINNENINKESGISNAEVNANDDFIKLSADIYTLSRKKACEEIKTKFDIDISVSDNYAKYQTDKTEENEFKEIEVE